MLCAHSNRPYFTVAGPKLPVSCLSPKGFSLLECVIAMFILAILVSVVLKHQAYLLDKQAEIEENAVKRRTAR